MNRLVKQTYRMLLGNPIGRWDREVFDFINRLEWEHADNMWFARDFERERNARKR